MQKHGASATARQQFRLGDGQAEPVDQGLTALLAAIDALTPEITSCAAAMDATRSVPSALLEKLAATGIYRMIIPKALGGGGYAIPEAIPVFEALARADGAIAWSTFVGTELGAIWEHFPEEATQVVFSDTSSALARAPLSPRGTAARTEGGYLVNGRWPLASGAYRNDWALVGAIVTENATPAIGAAGSIEMRIFLLPAAQTNIIETWDALGLRASGSNDLAVEDVFVPEERSIAFGWEHDGATPLGRLPLWFAFGPFHCAVALGIARAMLDEFVTLAQSKRPLFNPTIRLAEDPLVQHRMGSLETRLGAARAFLTAETQAAWKHAEAGRAFEPARRAQFRSMLAHIHAECGAIGDEIFNLAGSNVIYNSSSLQRRFRDLRTACQHIVGSTEIFRPFGAIAMGEMPALGTPL